MLWRVKVERNKIKNNSFLICQSILAHVDLLPCCCLGRKIRNHFLKEINMRLAFSMYISILFSKYNPYPVTEVMLSILIFKTLSSRPYFDNQA
jgi:hypothetical protein